MRAVVVCVVLAVVAVALPEGTASAEPSILARLAEPRTHAIMRHALAPGSNDPADFDIARCETQRNLNGDGRRQASRAGAMLREAGVAIAHLWTSQYCRCRETAELMAVAPVVEQSFLNSFISARWTKTDRLDRTQAALTALTPDETAVLVTHNVNAEALTGTRPVSGEIQIVRIDESGAIELLGSVRVPVF